ncbi:ligand-binding sensor domain-containing protein [Pararhodonellum marinum]|uniref:hypothetical protein n=1 Tax=Pararhodonellum marinum TaxID=2755358 RepID=UPI00188FB376|nr:hypothetical protein [Pararhodonellum marinum]
MKKVTILSFLCMAIFASCIKEKNTTPEENLSYLDYLSDKSIRNIVPLNGEVWIESSSICDSCHQHPYFSQPSRQLTKVNGNNFDYNPDFTYTSLELDWEGNLYALDYGNVKAIYQVMGLNEFTLYETFPNFGFHRYTFDRNKNIWLSGYLGIAFWDGSQLTVYNELTSDLPSNITHGLAIDPEGVVWVLLDFEGLLRIESGNWQHIPNSSIPGFQPSSYLSSVAIQDNNHLWFQVFAPGSINPNILTFENDKWIYHAPPNASSYGHLIKDVNGRIWYTSFVWENFAFSGPNLSYYNNSEWFSVDVSHLKSRIMTLNVYESKLLLGTQMGLFEIDLPKGY